MPYYTYLNKNTGEEWSELRQYSDRFVGTDDVIILLPCTPVAFPSAAGKDMERKADKWRSDFLQPKIDAMTGGGRQKISVDSA